MAEVVGWSGQVVAGGAGVKGALLKERGRYSVGTTPTIWYGEAELEDFVRRGLVTKRNLRAQSIADGVVLYATKEFIQPTDSDRLALAVDPQTFTLYRVGAQWVWIGYMPRQQAMSVLRGWGLLLIDSARSQLRNRYGERSAAASRAFADARRARYCIGAKGDEALRYDMFVTMAASALVLGRPIDPVVVDARIDLGDARLALIEADAHLLASEIESIGFKAQPVEVRGDDVVISTDRALPRFGPAKQHQSPRIEVPLAS